MEFKKFKIKGTVFSFLARYTITDEADQLCYTAKSNFWQTRMPLLDSMGSEVLTISRHLFALRYTYYIMKDGQRLFKVWKTLNLKPRIFIESLAEPDAFVVQGNFWTTEYAFYRNDKEFAYVSHKLFDIRGLYGAAIQAEEQAEVVLALVLIIDLIRKSKRRKRSN